ncbi:hypothetical protein [Mycolicibacterium sp. PDY-3]|uniref:hypothetical protein n=1 Tax=Mycolicibacterium sp. PDY-3 TaxID=3376069 RepID=UPI00379B7539
MVKSGGMSGGKGASTLGSGNALKWAVAIVAGLALAVVLVIGMNMSATTYTVDDGGDVLADGETIVPSAPAESSMAADSGFDYAIKKLASMRQESAQELRDQGMTVELPEAASDDNTSEELLGKYNADLHSIIKVAQTDRAEARRLLPGIMSPDNTDDYTRYEDEVIGGDYGENFVSVYGFRSVQDWSDNFYTAMVKGVDPNGAAMRYINVDLPDGVWNQVTFRRDNGEWIVHKMVSNSDPDFITDTFEFNKSIPPR